MRFLYHNKEYVGETATEIVETLLRETSDYTGNQSVKAFLDWSLSNLADRIPQREMGVSPGLPDEAVAFNYLCLLDSYDGADLIE